MAQQNKNGSLKTDWHAAWRLASSHKAGVPGKAGVLAALAASVLCSVLINLLHHSGNLFVYRICRS